MNLFLNLLVGHFIADYPLQGDFLGKFKNRHVPSVGVPWWHCLTAHAAIQAGMVAWITGSWELGAAEFVIHWATDYAKCEKWIGINTDQLIHVACKALWAMA